MESGKKNVFPIILAGLIIVALFFVLLFSVSLYSKQDQNSYTLEKLSIADTSISNASLSNISYIHHYFKEINACCPIETAPSAFVTRISCDDEAKVVTYFIKTSDHNPQSYAKRIAQSFASNNRSMALYQYAFFETDDKNLRLQNSMIEEGYSTKICILSDNDKEIYSQTIDVKTLAEVKQYALNYPEEAKKEVIKTIVNEYNHVLPLDWGDGITLQSAYFQWDKTPCTVFRLYVPRDIPITDVIDVINDSAFLSEYLTDPFFEQALVLTHSIKSGIRFTAISYNKRDSISADFSPSRLKEYADYAFQKKHRINP